MSDRGESPTCGGVLTVSAAPGGGGRSGLLLGLVPPAAGASTVPAIRTNTAVRYGDALKCNVRNEKI